MTRLNSFIGELQAFKMLTMQNSISRFELGKAHAMSLME